MLNRSNRFLVALLVAQIVLLAIAALMTGGTEERQVQPILSDVAADDVERITIADDLDNVMTFARGDAGWVLPDADDYPLDGAKVDEILGKLAGMDTRRLVASNPANFARLEVKEDDFRRRIELDGADKSTALFLGGSGGVDTAYVRRAEENDVYLGSGLNSWELSTQVSTWLDANYVNVPSVDVLEITVQNPEGIFVFRRDGENWTYAGLSEGEEFEDTKMPLILRNTSSIRMLEPLGLEALETYELDDSQVSVEVVYRQLNEDAAVNADETADDEVAEGDGTEAAPEYTEASYTLTFGAELDDGDIVLKSSDAEYYVLARDTVFNAFNEIKREDLVRQPTAEDESSGE